MRRCSASGLGWATFELSADRRFCRGIELPKRRQQQELAEQGSELHSFGIVERLEQSVLIREVVHNGCVHERVATIRQRHETTAAIRWVGLALDQAGRFEAIEAVGHRA